MNKSTEVLSLDGILVKTFKILLLFSKKLKSEVFKSSLCENAFAMLTMDFLYCVNEQHALRTI